MNEDGRIDDRDAQDGGGGFGAPTGEGLTIDGSYRPLNTYAVFHATVIATDGTVFTDLPLAAYQFPDTTIAFRLEDPAIHTLTTAGVARGNLQGVAITSGHTFYRAVAPEGHNDAFPCYTPGTLIDTASGPRPVEALRVGDLVWTLDHGFQPVRWVGARRIALPADGSRDHLRPIRIAASALGGDGDDLRVSPQHRVLLQSRIAQRMFGAAQVLVPAKALLELPGVSVTMDIDQVTYVHFACADHQIVRANGVLSESLYLGAQAGRMLGASAMAEITAIFPDLDLPAAAAPLLSVTKARALIARHQRNRRPLLQRTTC